MPKLLINVTTPQDAWLREETARLGLHGGVSELMRRLIDYQREPPLRLSLETLSPGCTQCGKPWGATVICAGGGPSGPLCGSCF